MSFGKRLLEARKKKALSQEDVANSITTKAPVIGRYERDEMKPSIEAAANMAQVLGVSLDWLVGNTDIELDRITLDRVIEIQKLPVAKQAELFNVMDAYIRDYKTSKSYSK